LYTYTDQLSVNVPKDRPGTFQLTECEDGL